MLCARECPDWCIYIDSHKETIPAPEGGRARQRNVLDRFAIDFALCMYCGICIEVCPFDALFWSPEFEYAEGDIRNLLHEKDTLATWVQTVPPPPAHDPGAEPPKELTAAPRRPASDRPARTPAAQRSRTATPPAPTPAATPEGGEPTPQERPATPPSAEATPEPAPGTPDTKPTPGTPAEPPTKAPEAGPSSPAPGGRPRRPMTNVRGIRPPGALPPTSQGDVPSATPGPEDTRPGEPPADRGTERTSEATPTERPRPPTADQPVGEARPSSEAQEARPEEEARPQEPDQTPEQDQSQASSTGQPLSGELSTASGEPPPKPDPEEQTSAASPRRRKMADPRSIRPPGRLGPDDTRESEEES
ncbi:4Fe-4S binding protein [Nonomuraea sp. MTCD27]|uniref:4Fe-4S binding protein n=1 Tax=Nonomuraea sp. MTCD27 TaxID=1676747 RepID=UPI0035BEDA45